VYVPAITVVAGAVGSVVVGVVEVVGAAVVAFVAAVVLFPMAEPPVTDARLAELAPLVGAAAMVTTTGTEMVVGCLFGRKLTLGEKEVESD